ncbi:MAG: hypothetical protein AAGA28_10745 [Pseudomonadota bacterium]
MSEIALRPNSFAVCLAAALLALSGCVSTNDPLAPYSHVRTFHLIGTQNMVICGDGDQFCDEQAARTCPGGYDVLSKDKNDPETWRTSMVIRCR